MILEKRIYDKGGCNIFMYVEIEIDERKKCPNGTLENLKGRKKGHTGDEWMESEILVE